MAGERPCRVCGGDRRPRRTATDPSTAMTLRVGVDSRRVTKASPRIATIASIGVAFLRAGCGKNGDKPTDTTRTPGNASVAVANQTDPQWVIQSQPHRDVAIVFVHGIFGDTLSTWSLGPGKPAFWSLMESIPDVGPKLDMYAFGFTSQMLAAGSAQRPALAR